MKENVYPKSTASDLDPHGDLLHNLPHVHEGFLPSQVVGAVKSDFSGKIGT